MNLKKNHYSRRALALLLTLTLCLGKYKEEVRI